MTILHEIARSAIDHERAAVAYELANVQSLAGDLDSAEAILAAVVDADAAEDCELLMARHWNCTVGSSWGVGGR